MMRVAFITAGPIEFASSRMRAYWVAPHIDGATVQRFDEILRTSRIREADAYIFQKAIDPGLVEQAQARGAKVWWDVCDPAWWWQPDMIDKLDMLDGVVASNQALADDFEAHSGRKAHVIPDRLHLPHFNRQREHHDTSPVRFIWFGLYCNRVAIASAWVNLVRVAALGHPVTLTIMDQHPDKPWVRELGGELPIAYYQWRLDEEVKIISQHDVALLPPYPGPWGWVKSINKQVTAWACGLPVIDNSNFSELRGLVESSELRKINGCRQTLIETQFDVAQSAAQWQELLGC